MATYNVTVQVHTQDEIDLDAAKGLLEQSLRYTQPRYRINGQSFSREALIIVGEVQKANEPLKAKVESEDPVQLFTSLIESIFDKR